MAKDNSEAKAQASYREHYCLFDTAIGLCGVAWSERGLTRVQLPEADLDSTERRLKTRSGGTCADDPPPQIKHLIAQIQRYATGERVDFSSAVLDLSKVGPIDREICAAARAIGWGATATYGDLARQTGTPGDARGVGQAMSRNPVPIVIPCHRVLAKGNKLGGFSAYGGTITKERLLALEGVRVGDDAPLLPGLFSKQRRSA
jgi:methylated-DNA-[protein]-cysteine S-methyltransferase